jgi:hypothetical protein
MWENKPLYLSSLDSRTFQTVRRCVFVRETSFPSGKVAVVARIDPPVIGQYFNLGRDVDTVLITSRFEGDSIGDIRSFPFFVHIAVPKRQPMDLESPMVDPDEFDVVAWAELYRTVQEASRTAAL